MMSGFLSLDMPVLLDRINYISPIKYSSYVLALREFEGLVFECDETKIKRIETQLNQYFNKLNIEEEFFHKELQKNSIRFNLKNNTPDTSTLYIRWEPKYKIEDEIVYLPTSTGQKEVITVSKKEILLALMQSGRKTIF